MIIVADGDIVEEVNAKYDVEIEYIANLFWEGDFMNYCYKSLWIEEEADEEFNGYEWENEEEIKLRNLVRKYLRDCFPGVDHILVDVSW
jgi:hypothetical protein